MDLTVFRQASKTRPDGHIIYKGEDAQPYVGKNIMLVADGLGGAAAIRHQKFNQELFDENKLFDLLFDGVFGDLDDIELREYVTKSFYEFTSIKDCYFDNVNNIKKSGYFASRIVAAIFIFWAKRLVDTFSVDEIAKMSQEKRDAWLKQQGQDYTERIRRMLKGVADNANLIYETSFSGLALLGTTLCATMIFEDKHHVDAFYFVSGDSRPYMWNSDGLFQVSTDQEREDGGMTNYIRANGEFEIICEYKRFKKPCVLFNASDGIFDSAHFKLSQMALEKLLLETISEADNIEDVGGILEEIFLEYGTHDDSSTAALKTFGYDDFAELKKAAMKRLSTMQKIYFNDFPDLLEHDYQNDIDEIKQNQKVQYKNLCKTLWANEKVRRHFAELAEKSDHETYKMQMEEMHQIYNEFYDKIVCLCRSFTRKDENASQGIRNITESEANTLASKLISGEYNIGILSISDEHANQLKEWLTVCKDMSAKIDNAAQNREKDVEDAAKKLWDSTCENEQNILDYLLSRQIITDVEHTQYLQQFPIEAFQIDEVILSKAARQKKLLAQYDKLYYSLIANN